MRFDSRIFIAGHSGMVGSAIVRKLKTEGFHNLLLKTSSELDLRDQSAVRIFFATEKPEFVFLAAAKVGGIHANNTYRAEFLYDNLMMELNVIHASWENNVTKLLFLGSSCIYPRLAPQPLKEEYLLSGPLEQTNEPYAIAKIAGIKLCESYRKQYGCNFISAMPTNLYGPGDNYHPENSHVLPALLRRIHEAKELGKPSVIIWGSGNPLREFLHVDDLAGALLFLMLNYNDMQFVNVGSSEEISIAALAEQIKVVVGYSGKMEFDKTKPDGTPRKLMDSSVMRNLGWESEIPLSDGLVSTYQDFMKGGGRRTG